MNLINFMLPHNDTQFINKTKKEEEKKNVKEIINGIFDRNHFHGPILTRSLLKYKPFSLMLALDLIKIMLQMLIVSSSEYLITVYSLTVVVIDKFHLSSMGHSIDT